MKCYYTIVFLILYFYGNAQILKTNSAGPFAYTSIPLKSDKGGNYDMAFAPEMASMAGLTINRQVKEDFALSCEITYTFTDYTSFRGSGSYIQDDLHYAGITLLPVFNRWNQIGFYCGLKTDWLLAAKRYSDRTSTNWPEARVFYRSFAFTGLAGFDAEIATHLCFVLRYFYGLNSVWKSKVPEMDGDTKNQLEFYHSNLQIGCRYLFPSKKSKERYDISSDYINH
ncbi:hypothetical protein SAMN05216464_113126 [Mucilaginibacter pineti]|uniref:Uncharacterized protein n=2 Tax=Mucilaginibacter pineti TaxID=1391627 RepID=A0A1G7IQY2_9SPHI|nr:hypothetical protein SAMN05216464_113126 [Mucilaginibacter pineti]